MSTIEHVVENNGRMLVFDLARNLKVVGTYHALDAEDKEQLEQLIGNCDFVASEGIRMPYGIKLKLSSAPFAKGFPYNSKYGSYDLSLLDSAYVKWFVRAIKKEAASINKVVFDLTKKNRKIEDEFSYCRKITQEKGKEFYFVDLTTAELIKHLISQRSISKIKHMLSREKYPLNHLNQLLLDIREKIMLERIVEHEGPISQLQRRGLFPVGYTHALNFQAGKYNYLLQ
jgi:hypothetical protein